MADHLLYWKLGATESKEPIFFAASNQLQHVQLRDTVWIVNIPERGRLELVGRFKVNGKTRKRADIRRLVGHDDFWEAEWYAYGPRRSAARI